MTTLILMCLMIICMIAAGIYSFRTMDDDSESVDHYRNRILKGYIPFVIFAVATVVSAFFPA